MPKLTLKYFDLNGLGEAIRYILKYTDQKFEDVRYEYATWPNKEIKDVLPFGKMPILEVDDRVLHQSLAIAKYVSQNTELVPSDHWEQAVLDSLAYTIYDFDKYVIAHNHATPEQKEAARKTLCDVQLDFYFSRFEKRVKDNNGFFGGKLSWVDFIFVGILECANLFLDEGLEKNYPALTNLVHTIRDLPRVKEYIKARKPYVRFSAKEKTASPESVFPDRYNQSFFKS